MTRFKANLLLLCTGIVWGIGFIAQETAMDDIGPVLFVGIRFLLAALALLVFAWVEYRRSHYCWRELGAHRFVGLGLLFFFGMLLQQIGLVYTTVTNAGFLTGLYIVLVPLTMLLFFRQRQPAETFTAALLALLGIFLINDASIDGINSGDLLVIVSSCFWAAHVIYVGNIVRSVQAPYTIAFIQFAVAGTAGLLGYWLFQPLLAFEPRVEFQQIVPALPELLYAGLIAGAFAFTLQIIAQRHTSEANAAILLSSEALFAALFATLLLGEVLSLTAYTGCLLVFIAMLLVQLVPMYMRRGN